MTQLIARFIADESGATAVEYGLIASLIALAAITAMSALDISLRGMFLTIGSEIDGAVQGGSTN